ncbi:MAG: tRNA (adenosine(37)-N6)-threonylcarbamoyltransferase complex dimerization subunit type 1 TsaB [Thermoanaerobaculia bacterium]
MSTWLAFDAGSPVTSAAVARGGTLLAASTGASRSGPSLLQQIDDSLQRATVAARELDGIVVLSGPGSFTGIRVALATALGLRAALAVPVFALSNLAALALHAGPGTASRFLALIDALRDEWFVQEFRFEARGLAAEGTPERLPASTLFAPADARLAVHLAQTLPSHLAELPVERVAALASGVASAASAGTLGALLSGELAPLYLRGFTPRNARP